MAPVAKKDQISVSENSHKEGYLMKAWEDVIGSPGAVTFEESGAESSSKSTSMRMSSSSSP